MSTFWQIEKEMHDAVTCLHQASAMVRKVYGLHPGDRENLLKQVFEARRLVESLLGQVGDLAERRA